MVMRIKPRVQEISLAFNPANKRKFILHKDVKGGNVMPKFAISVLEKEELATDEAAFAKFLKDQKLDKDTAEAVCGAYRLLALSKDKLPETFMPELRKSFPSMVKLFVVQKDEKGEKKVRAAIEKELKVSLEKEIRIAVEKEMNMTKDEEVKTLQKDLETLQKESEETKKLLVVEKDARRLMELRKEIEGFGVPGDLDKLAKDVLVAENTSPELGARFLESYKEMGTSFKASNDIFKELGSSGSGVNEDEFAGKVTKLVKDKMTANADLLEIDARREVMKENPSMYAEYNKEHYRRIREAS